MERVCTVNMKHIDKRFGSIHALEGMDFSAYAGEITAIVGDNGSGKSTLIKILSGCLAPDRGVISINGTAHQRLTVQTALSLGIATVYQDLALDNFKDCAENIFLGCEKTWCGIFLDRQGMEADTAALLQRLGIAIPDLRQPVERLSGGQRQAVAIARVMHCDASIYIFDEPTSAMGVKETGRIMALLKKLKSQGKTIILISHDLFQVFDLADSICVMEHGHFLGSYGTAHSSPQEIYDLIVKKEEPATYE